MSVHAACSLARAARASGVVDTDIDRMANFGAGGRYPGNEHRDFRKMIEKTRSFDQLQPQQIPLTLRSESGEGETNVLTDVIAPYEVFHFLHKSQSFKQSMLSDKTSLAMYWRRFFSRRAARGTNLHPLQSKRPIWHTAIPLLFFTDGAEFSKSSAAEGQPARSHIVCKGVYEMHTFREGGGACSTCLAA